MAEKGTGREEEGKSKQEEMKAKGRVGGVNGRKRLLRKLQKTNPVEEFFNSEMK